MATAPRRPRGRASLGAVRALPTLGWVVAGGMLIASPAAAEPQAGAGAAACPVRGLITLDEVRVEPAGSAPFAFRTSQVVEVSPEDARSERMHVRVDGALRFEGTAPARAIPYALGRPLRVAGGMLSLPGDVRVLDVRRAGAGLAIDVDPGGAIFRHVAVGCGDIVLRAPPRRVLSGARAFVLCDHRTLVPRDHTSLVLRSQPGAGESLEFELTTTLPFSLPFTRIARRGDFVRVTHRFSDGSVVTGWAPSTDFASCHMLPARPGGSRMERAFELRPICGYPTDIGYVGEGTIAGDTDIRVGPGGAVWARVTRPFRAIVHIAAGAAWAEIWTLPGLVPLAGCGDRFEHAVVPVDRVRRPP